MIQYIINEFIDVWFNSVEVEFIYYRSRGCTTYSVVSKWTGFYPLVEVLAFSHGDVAVGLVLMWLSYVKIATVTVCFS